MDDPVLETGPGKLVMAEFLAEATKEGRLAEDGSFVGLTPAETRFVINVLIMRLFAKIKRRPNPFPPESDVGRDFTRFMLLHVEAMKAKAAKNWSSVLSKTKH